MLMEVVYKVCGLKIRKKELNVDLIPLAIHDFDMILGMDWLSSYHTLIDCFKK